jgi:hypothetical protein
MINQTQKIMLLADDYTSEAMQDVKYPNQFRVKKARSRLLEASEVMQARVLELEGALKSADAIGTTMANRIAELEAKLAALAAKDRT